MTRRKEKLTLERPINFEAVIPKRVEDFASGSGHISGLGDYFGRNAIVIILPKGEK